MLAVLYFYLFEKYNNIVMFYRLIYVDQAIFVFLILIEKPFEHVR